MIVVITGTCAVGKSTVSRLLLKRLGKKTHLISVDRERFTRKNPHTYRQAYLSNVACAKEARKYEKKGYVVVVQGNYIFTNLKPIYGDVHYVHLMASPRTIYKRHCGREKKHSLWMIFGSWFCNWILFRKSIQTDGLTEDEVVEKIMKQLAN